VCPASVLVFALDHLATCAIVHTIARQCAFLGVGVDLAKVTRTLAHLPRIGQGASQADYNDAVLDNLEPVMPRAILQGFVRVQLRRSSYYFRSFRALLARNFLEDNAFPDDLQFLRPINEPYHNLLRRMRAINCELHADRYLAALTSLVPPMMVSSPAPLMMVSSPALAHFYPMPAPAHFYPMPAPAQDPLSFNTWLGTPPVEFPPSPTPPQLLLDPAGARLRILEWIRDTPAIPNQAVDPAAQLTTTRAMEAKIAYVAAHVFNLNARGEGPPKYIFDTFAAYCARRADHSPSFAFQLIQACTRHDHLQSYNTARVIPYAPLPDEEEEAMGMDMD
jgi:hypothetical protein